MASARAASRQKLGEDPNAPQEFSFQPPASQAELNKALQEFREGRARRCQGRGPEPRPEPDP
ncbi:MAG: hypothetical protein WKG07_30235 [Hymenobacter sp.]